MSTKIGGFDSTPVPPSTGRTVKRSSDSSQSVAPESGVASGEPNITDSARHLSELEQSVQALPAVNEARVANVSARLANGSYEINAERIADKLLKSEQDLARLE